MSETAVYVVEFPDRAAYQMKWADPLTGKTRWKSTGIKKGGPRARKQAEQVAADWRAEINSGAASIPTDLAWEDFCQRYLDQYASGLKDKTQRKIRSVFNHITDRVNPRRLTDLNEQRLSEVVRQLRAEGKSEDTISGVMAHLKASLRWAVGQKLLKACPTIPKPPRKKKAGRTSKAKGRPITLEEFERMLAKVPDIIGREHAEEWVFFLKGLWASGLRLEESTNLYWNRDDRLRPILELDPPLLDVPGELEKGHTDRLLPMAPEFAIFLQAVPKASRKGRVFRLPGGGGQQVSAEWAGKRISQIGKAAGVVVHADAKTSGKVKFASAHDIRRAFGDRWAQKLMPAQLMELMRHESIETTLKYYVATNARRTAETCWEVYRADEGAGFTPSSPELKKPRAK